jgi:hypothetical protein
MNTSSSTSSPTVRSVLPASILLFLSGWGGLFFLMNTIAPTDWKPLWLFYFLAVLGVCGLALPAVTFLNLRFPGKPPATHVVIVRQAIWLGIYLPTLAWLRIGRVLTPLLALLLALGLLLIEGLLRFREYSQWKP